MIFLIAKRAGMAAITLFGVAVVVFILLRVAPGDPIAMMIGPGATAEDIARLRASYGLDQSLFNQFWIWLGSLIQGDFGTSISRRVDVGQLLLERLPATIELALMALLVAVLLGGAIAIVGTLVRRHWSSGALDGVNGLLLAIPEFVWALALVLVLGVAFPVLPLSGRINPSLSTDFRTGFYLLESVLTLRFGLAGDLLRHMAMPVLALALPLAGIIARVLREALSEAMMQDYVTLARVKGMSEIRLVWSEALRNAIGPTLALTGVQFTFLIGGTVIVEKIFSYPGLGNMAIDAVINRDFPLIQGLVLMFGVLFILINLVVDFAVVAANPRLRHG
ncbi:ABC transporter permease [Devosia rhizoryzae]|uniref:ABC transporter permease n=1 Tax=Devosia rhizoryzae TaxID=2774137 RepID=A0ABX7C913_9HYPH|nr:ABC transporter permease [Devosia rhizoryzae]QQR40760.1 ABC transporter permease [Devosia rhizoryzae]